MADNTVTLIIDGNVPLDAFAKGVSSFNELVSALSAKVASGPVSWILDDLQFSSAVATARIEGSPLDIGVLVAAYSDVGACLESGAPLRYGKPVSRAARKLVEINAERIRLETSTREAIIPLRMREVLKDLESATEPISQIKLATEEARYPVPILRMVRGRKPSFGGVRGRIQTLTSRGGLRFTLFDVHQDKAVSCYFEEGKQDIVRDLWGKFALVEGTITRDPISGRPLSIREVQDVTPLPEPRASRDFEAAMGVAPSLFNVSAEEAIRKIRDAQ